MVTILPCDISHVEQILEIECNSFSDPWTVRMITGELQDEHCYYIGAYVDGKMVGYAGFSAMFEQGEIRSIASIPSVRRQGIASTMLVSLERKAVELHVETISLEVRVSNESAIELYKKFGYEVISRRKSYYRLPREDALVMQKNIMCVE